jgi:hypothetical protein
LDFTSYLFGVDPESKKAGNVALDEKSMKDFQNCRSIKMLASLADDCLVLTVLLLGGIKRSLDLLQPVKIGVEAGVKLFKLLQYAGVLQLGLLVLYLSRK